MEFVLKFTILCASHILSPVYACPTSQVKLLCKDLVTSSGFTYQVPQHNIDLRICEHGWYYQNGTFFVDSTVSSENLGFVVRVNPWNLTVTSCENLLWQLDCDDIGVEFHCTVNYTVGFSIREILPRNYTIQRDKEGGHFLGWLTAVIVGVMIIIILAIAIWFTWKKRKESQKTLSNLRRYVQEVI